MTRIGPDPVGTTARLALALALYTGSRRADLAVLGRQHERDSWLGFTRHKGRNKSRVRLEIPIIQELRRIIEGRPTGDLTYLLGATGRPLLANSLGNSFRDWYNQAKLPQCSLHGLRKAAASRLAELGCSEFQIMSITGHQTSKKVARYTKAASQRVRAAAALELVPNKSVPLLDAEARSRAGFTADILTIKTKR